LKGLATGAETRHKWTQANASRRREFEGLYLQSYSLVYNFVRTRMASDADTEDVVSEAFLKAARAFGSFDPKRARFSTWVISIAKNCMASYFRKQRPTVALEEAPLSAFGVSGEQDRVDDRELVKQLLGCLDDTERELVAMKYRDGLRNVDIARNLHMNSSTVSTVLSRALSKMRATMERG